MKAAGYSATPLVQKLGIKPGARVFIAGAPDHYAELISPLPEGATISRRLTNRTDVIHLFASEQSKLERSLRAALKSMKTDATIWVSWPKKASKVTTDITEDVIREIALPMGLVDVKVCAVDATWSGLKLVIRKGRRVAASSRESRAALVKSNRKTRPEPARKS
jgi:hypothetical protein